MAKTKTHARNDVLAFIAILLMSATTMLWLFWRFPLQTAVVTVLALMAFGVSARLARSVDTENMSDFDHGRHRV